jgi:hypothetical protein
MPKGTGKVKDDDKRICDPSEPVPGFPLKYCWHTGRWRDIFDRQIALIQRDIAREKAQDKLLIYLSCPISSRGGGYSGTNVDVAKHIEGRLRALWGEKFWILNPAQYQLESKSGTGMMDLHAKELKYDLAELRSTSEPVGGDYMRMWTAVLVTNGEKVGSRLVGKANVNSGQSFDAFYFIGPRDVHEFFVTSGSTLTAGIQEYFSRKFATDSDFRDYFSVTGINWGRPIAKTSVSSAQSNLRSQWEIARGDFFRYYAVRASATFSLGSHDEWLILKLLNEKRRDSSRKPKEFMVDGDVAEQIAGFFDGVQINMSSTELGVSRGYSA